LAAVSSQGEPPVVAPVTALRGLPNKVLRVLVVDDNSDAAELLARVMTELGCEARTAHDGPSALALFEIFRPELALVDIGLPVMDGYELAQHIRNRPDTAPVQLVAVTGYGQKRDVEQALASGFDEHLTKPVDISRLTLLIAALNSTP
jgi:CheY-like chemotaxis protein